MRVDIVYTSYKYVMRRVRDDFNRSAGDCLNEAVDTGRHWSTLVEDALAWRAVIRLLEARLPVRIAATDRRDVRDD